MDLPLDIHALFFAVGFIAGSLVLMVIFLPGRQHDKEAADELVKIKNELASIKDEYQIYRNNVGHHFSKTAELVHSMTKSYHSIYQHLAEGAQSLCDDQGSNFAVQFSESKRVKQTKGQAVNAAVILNEAEGELFRYTKLRKQAAAEKTISKEKKIAVKGAKSTPEPTGKPTEKSAANTENTSSNVPRGEAIEVDASSNADLKPAYSSSAVLRAMESEVRAHSRE